MHILEVDTDTMETPQCEAISEDETEVQILVDVELAEHYIAYHILPVCINKVAYGAIEEESRLMQTYKYLARIREFLLVFEDENEPISNLRDLYDSVRQATNPKDIFVTKDLLIPLLNRFDDKFRERIISTTKNECLLELKRLQAEGETHLLPIIESMLILWGFIEAVDLEDE